MTVFKKTFIGLVVLLFSDLSFADNRLLLVGTTGDYPPLSIYSQGKFSGKDIQIIQNFATANQFKLEFVQTSWMTLSADLAANKFTIAVGGISSNPQRMKLFYLSAPIEHSEKVPLIKCKDLKRFNNFAAIDQENIIVVENRGGTNQDFALKNIKKATIILLPNNYDALARLTAKKNPADVMFTDDIEANYRHQINSKLCLAILPEKFPSADKVFLFQKTPSGQQLQKTFNHWWKLNKVHYN